MDPNLLPEPVWLKIKKQWNSSSLACIWFCKPLYSSTFTLSSPKMLLFPSQFRKTSPQHTWADIHIHSPRRALCHEVLCLHCFETPDFMALTQILSYSLIFFRFNQAGICYSFTSHGIKVSSKCLIMFSNYWRETLVHNSSWQDLSADKRIQTVHIAIIPLTYHCLKSEWEEVKVSILATVFHNGRLG